MVAMGSGRGWHRLVGIAACLVMAVSIAACGEGGGNGATPTVGATSTFEATPAAEEELVRLVVEDADGDRSEEVMVEIAATEEERQRGLMHREHLPEDQGMLFLYEEPSATGFWMKDTLIPLDIAYLGRDGRIQEVRHGEPLNEAVLSPEQPYWMVLEVNAEWLEERGFGPGDRVVVPGDLRP